MQREIDIEIGENLEFVYGVSYIRALEVRLLTHERINRMIEAKTANELLKILQDTIYADALPSHPSLYESIIKTEREKLFKIMEKLLPEETIRLLRLRYDLHNIKTMLKGKITEKKVEHLILPYGNISKKELERIFREETYYNLPFDFEKGIEEAVDLYYTRKDPRFLDVALDKHYYRILLENTENSYLTNLIKTEIDLVNLKSLLRAKYSKMDKSFYAEALIDGGFLSKEVLLKAYDADYEEIPQRFAYSDYKDILSEGIEYLTKENSFLLFEKLCDNQFLDVARIAKYLTFGEEPIIGYYFGRENEFKILRIIFVGKLNKIPEKLIKDRVPDVY